jgi:hypothetical protein
VDDECVVEEESVHLVKSIRRRRGFGRGHPEYGVWRDLPEGGDGLEFVNDPPDVTFVAVRLPQLVLRPRCICLGMAPHVRSKLKLAKRIGISPVLVSPLRLASRLPSQPHRILGAHSDVRTVGTRSA